MSMQPKPTESDIERYEIVRCQLAGGRMGDAFSSPGTAANRSKSYFVRALEGVDDADLLTAVHVGKCLLPRYRRPERVQDTRNTIMWLERELRRRKSARLLVIN
jgi:hypothetical protein